MRREDVDKIMKVIPEGASVADAIQFLLDKKLMNHTAARDAEIVYRLRENMQDEGPWRAKIRTSCQMNISDRTVYRVADRFEES